MNPLFQFNVFKLKEELKVTPPNINMPFLQKTSHSEMLPQTLSFGSSPSETTPQHPLAAAIVSVNLSPY